MKLLLGIVSLLCAVAIGYIRYDMYRQIRKSNLFLCDFATALVRNNSHEMLSFSELLRKKYLEHFSADINHSDTASALSLIENNFSGALGFTEISSLFEGYINAGGEELKDIEKELISTCEKYSAQAEKLLKESGNSSLIMFPSVAVIALILLI